MGWLRDAPVRYAGSGEVNIAFQVLGSGAANIVYVPGFLNSIEATAEEPAIERHLERMTTFATLVMFDKRGSGLSDRVPDHEVADRDAQIADLAAVMDAVGWERATLFGTADGAATAILFAVRYPERVDRLVILEGTARLMADEGYDVGWKRDVTPPLEAFNERWGNETDPLLVEVLAPSMAEDVRWRRALARMERRAGTPRGARSYWQHAMVRADIRTVLADVRVPTLVLNCAGDVMIPVGQGRALAAEIPDARFVELPGSDHFHWFTNAARVAAETQEFLTGSRGTTDAQRRLCTVLFTDIVGSTAQAARLGDSRWRDLLNSHDRLLRSHLVRYEGKEVQFTGDGMLALFDDPTSALDCATALTSATRQIGLEIRAGIHTGMIEVRGDDVAGMAVHITARVMAAASASEVLITRTVRDLLVGADLRLQPRGPRDFKGVTEPIEVYALQSG